MCVVLCIVGEARRHQCAMREDGARVEGGGPSRSRSGRDCPNGKDRRLFAIDAREAAVEYQVSERMSQRPGTEIALWREYVRV